MPYTVSCHPSPAFFVLSMAAYWPVILNCQSGLWLKNITEFIIYLVFQYLTCFSICCSWGAGPEVIQHVCISIIYIHFIFPVLQGSDSSAVGAVGCFYCLKIKLPAFIWVSCQSHIIFIVFSILMSGIPSRTGPSPSSTMNLHLAFLSLCLNLTLHIPNCLISDWLYF